jgi:hypothetical protein
MSEIPLPVDEPDDTEGHCAGVTISNLQDERELGPTSIPRAGSTGVTGADEAGSDVPGAGANTDAVAEEDDVSGSARPPRSLGS